MAHIERMRRTLYEKYGPDVIKAVVHELYDRVLEDPSISYYFDGTDLKALRKHQFASMSYILGSPQVFNLARLRDAHHNLGIQEEEFETFLKHLDGAMRKFNFDIEDRAMILALIRTYKAFIIQK